MITTGVFAYLFFNAEKPHEDKINKELFSKKNCKVSVSPYQGKAVTAEAAKAAIQDYKQIYSNEKDTIMGYIIGLEHVDSILKDIKRYNSSYVPNADSTITGLRFYHSTRMLELNGNDTRVKDLVMIPVMKNGTDIDTVFNKLIPARSLSIYSHFRPCPRICGSESKNLYLRD